MSSQEGVEYTNKPHRRGKCWFALEGARNEWHDSSSQDLGLLRMAGEHGSMVGDYRFDQLQAEGLLQAKES